MAKRKLNTDTALDDSRLDFYEVDQKYIDALKLIEPKIPDVNYPTHEKFMCGILFTIGEHEYFAPVSSFTKSQKTNFIIKNKSGKPVGSIRFSFMFPSQKTSGTSKIFPRRMRSAAIC